MLIAFGIVLFSLQIYVKTQRIYPMKHFICCILLLAAFASNAQSDLSKEEQLEYMKQMGSRTAKQTWWFFNQRLKEPLSYTYQHVYIEFLNVYVKDIKQLPSGKYQGVVDLELPHDQSFNETNQDIKFDSAEIDDWFMVDDTYLVGGFLLRIMQFDDLKPFKKKGRFSIPFQSINEDFIKSSKMYSDLSYDGDEPVNVQELFPGGNKGFHDSVQAYLYYPDYAHYMGIEGFVTVEFTLLVDHGIIENIKVIRGVGAGLNDIAKNAFRQTAKYWKPTTDKNNTTRSIHFTQSIRFYFRDYEQTFK